MFSKLEKNILTKLVLNWKQAKKKRIESPPRDSGKDVYQELENLSNRYNYMEIYGISQENFVCTINLYKVPKVPNVM